MKRISIIIITVFALISIYTTAVLASSTTRIVDEAKVLTKEQVIFLENKIQGIREKYKFDMGILIRNDLEGRSIEFSAKTYYKKNNYGTGEGKDGTLLLVSPEERKYYIFTSGYGNKVFNSYIATRIGENLSNVIKNGNYYAGFEGYLNDSDTFLLKANEGEVYSTSNPIREGSIFKRALDAMYIVIPISLIIALISVIRMKGKHKSIMNKESANEYVDNDSFNIRKQSDVFLYSNIEKIKLPKPSSKEKSNNSAQGGGGGKF